MRGKRYIDDHLESRVDVKVEAQEGGKRAEDSRLYPKIFPSEVSTASVKHCQNTGYRNDVVDRDDAA